MEFVKVTQSVLDMSVKNVQLELGKKECIGFHNDCINNVISEVIGEHKDDEALRLMTWEVIMFGECDIR